MKHPNNTHTSVAILAGGKATRFGRKQKALTPWNEGTILSETISKFSKFSDDLFVISNSHLNGQNQDLRVYEDIITDKGPLSGVYAALSYALHSEVLVMACDMPFLDVNTAIYLQGVIAKNKGKVLMPVWEKGPEPMFGIWPVSIKCRLEKWLLGGYSLKIMEFLKTHHLCVFVPISNDSNKYQFYNINSTDDFDVAKQMNKKII